MVANPTIPAQLHGVAAMQLISHVQCSALVMDYAETRKKKMTQMTHETTKSHLEGITVICTLAAILDSVAILNSDICKLVVSFHKALCLN